MPGIETGLDRRGAQPWPWQGRPADLPLDPTYAISDDKLNANWRQIMEAIGVVLVTGQMCQEGTNTYGASTTTYCRLTLPDGFTELEDWLHIGDGSRQWRVQVAVANEISFSDAELIDGTAGTADYNTIQNDLMMWTSAKAKLIKKVTKNEIVTGDFADGLHGDDIPVSQGSADSIKDQLDDIYVEHESDGTHSAGIIGNTELDKDNVLITQTFVNRIRNGAFNINGAASRDYWTDVGTPSVSVNLNSKTFFPLYDLECTTDALTEGVIQDLIGFQADVPIRLSFVAWGDAGGEAIKAELYTGAESDKLEITLTVTPTIYYVVLTPTDITSLNVRFASNTASTITWHIGLVTVCLGDIHTHPERSSQDVLFDAVHTATFYIANLATADQIVAKWTPMRSIKLLRIDAYAQVAPDEDCTIKLSDGADDVDVVILDTAHQGANTTTTQEYAAGTELTITTPDNALSTGSLCMVVYQYRMV